MSWRRLLTLGALVPLALGALIAAPQPAGAATSVAQASTSTRGVTAHQINVVFPVVNLAALATIYGFSGDVEYVEQTKAIKLFVGAINKAGGINGRKINPIISFFNPTNATEEEALCKDWTEGSPAAFAVLDGVGDFTGTPQLCVTQDGHTPMLAQWTTVSQWTKMGAPYLWWTGPSDDGVLKAVVAWGLKSGELGAGVKVGVIAGDRTSDQLALNDDLLPDLRAAHITPIVETIAANPSESAETGAEAPLDIAKFKSEGVSTVIPLMPFNAFFPVLQAEGSQKYYPHLMLSDYEDSIESSLGLDPIPYKKELDGQSGVTTFTLGGIDDWRPESQGGYDPSVRACFKIWHKAYPEIPKGNQSFFIEEQGPVQGWCQEINLFATAAKMAGRNLNRRTFVEAMSRIHNYNGGYSPILSYGPDKYSGPVEYQVVTIHDNSPPSSMCHMPLNKIPQYQCWVTIQHWKPLPS